MKIMTVLGTRPEVIRLSLIVKKLDEVCEHILVHTGQNYEESLNDVFFRELNVRPPDVSLGIRDSTFGGQVGKIISETENVLSDMRPDKLLILGDTNSGLSAIPAKRLGIPVYHMEAGNRCYDDRVPEEVNRRIIDHSSDVLMPYTYRSKENLVREGIERERIYVIGNPIYEVLTHFEEQIDQTGIFHRLGLSRNNYFLVTMHRAENVDTRKRLTKLVASLELLSDSYHLPIACSLHPRTKSKMEQFGLNFNYDQIQYLSPLGFFDFVALEKSARCVLSDSGTVQEECCIFRIPNVTIRDVTERPETIECGSNILSGVDSGRILRIVAHLLKQRSDWRIPEEYLASSVANTVVKILSGYNDFIDARHD